MKWTSGLLLLLLPVGAALAQSQPFQVEGACPAGSRLMTSREASEQRAALCPALGFWTISRLANGASIGGSGYGCTPGENDTRDLGHSVCVAGADAGGSDHRHMLEEYEAESAESQVATFNLDPNLVRLVQGDLATGNFLFRGNMPVANGAFQYDDLVQSMRNAAQAAGRTLPPQFRIIDISLVNELTPGEKNDLAVEMAYWNSHAGQGRLVNHPIYGSLTSPHLYPEAERRRLERKPSLGHVGQLVDDIQHLLTTRSADGVPVLLYVHCEAGKDRTGETIAAWSMKYMGVSYVAALANANAIAGRDISRFSKNGLQWYAYDLKDYVGIPTVGPIP